MEIAIVNNLILSIIDSAVKAYVFLLIFLLVGSLLFVGIPVVGIIGSSHGEDSNENEELKSGTNFLINIEC